jgi:hypothetical protein
MQLKQKERAGRLTKDSPLIVEEWVLKWQRWMRWKKSWEIRKTDWEVLTFIQYKLEEERMEGIKVKGIIFFEILRVCRKSWIFRALSSWVHWPLHRRPELFSYLEPQTLPLPLTKSKTSNIKIANCQCLHFPQHVRKPSPTLQDSH